MEEHRSIKYPCIPVHGGFTPSTDESVSCSFCGMRDFLHVAVAFCSPSRCSSVTILSMKVFRLLLWLTLAAAQVSAGAQFTLDISPVAPGTGVLGFTLEPNFYYRLESSGSLTSEFAPASGWMLGKGNPVTWPIHYPTGAASSTTTTTATTGDIFSVYPFDNRKTLVTWSSGGNTNCNALIAQDYSSLPPLLTLSGSPTTPHLTLLVGSLVWSPAYEALDPALLTTEQQTTLARLTSRYADVIAAASGGSGGPGVVIDSPKQFFRIRRMGTDFDGDGLDWAAEVFQYGTNPELVDTDGDAIDDDVEIALGSNPLNPFNGQPPNITTYGGNGQIGWTNSFLAGRIELRVENQDRRPIYNYPVQVFVSHGQISASNDGTGMLGSDPILHTDSQGFLRFYVKHNVDFNTDCSVSVGIDYGISQQWVNFASRILGNPNGVAAPVQMDGAWSADGSLTLSWQDTTGNATEFVIERSLDDESHYVPVARVPASVTHWTDPHPPSAPNVYYRANSTH